MFSFYVSGDYSWTCQPIDFSNDPEVSYFYKFFCQKALMPSFDTSFLKQNNLCDHHAKTK